MGIVDKKYGWVSECEWRYKPAWLRAVAENYELYESAKVGEDNFDRKIDFDMALATLSSRRRFVIERLIRGETDDDMERKGYYEVAKYRKSSFRLMAKYLNGGE